MGTKERATKSSIGEDVSATGDGGWVNMGDDTLDGVVASVEIKTLTGGTSPETTPQLEHSPDKSVVHILDTASSALDAVGSKYFFTTQARCFRWIRLTWVTTGSPTTMTADSYIEA